MAYPEYLPRQTLYHYTSIDGLSAIAKSKCLRFSDLAAANDPREIHLGREKMFVALRSVLDETYKSVGGQNLLNLITQMIEYFGTVQIFCCCLSLLDDSLPMWNAYGANYSGVSIGFRPRAMLDSIGRIQKVRYLDPSKKDEFRAFALDIAAQIQNPAEIARYIDAGTSVITAATALKHNTWSYENEVRLVFVQRRERSTGQLPDVKYALWSEPLERTVNGQSVRYFDFPFGLSKNGIHDAKRSIEHIVIGPKCTLSVDDINTLLQENGFEGFTVRKSSCEIR